MWISGCYWIRYSFNQEARGNKKKLMGLFCLGRAIQTSLAHIQSLITCKVVSGRLHLGQTWEKSRSILAKKVR